MRRLLLLLVASVALAQPAWIPATTKQPIPAGWLPGPFVKGAQPLLTTTNATRLSTPAVVKVEERYRMLYRGVTPETPGGEFYLADSLDGVKWERYPQPVFGGTDWYDENGVDDARLVYIGKLYYLTYTGWEGKLAHLCVASSPDLRGWKKHGPIFAQFPTNAARRFAENWTRAGAIFPEKLKYGPYKGRYLMVFGDSDLWMATSEDLVRWNYRAEPVLRVRLDHRDSGALFAGPPLVRCPNGGIVVVYGGADREDRWATYAALLDQSDPSVVLARTETPILEATQIWEAAGAVATSLVGEGSYWNLYYGGGSQAIGLGRANR